MAEEFQTSFIPKKTVDSGPQKRRKSVNIFTLIGLIVFLVAVAFAVGLFLYGKLVERNIVRKEAALEQAQESFEPSLIEELVRLDTRIDSADTLLASHIAPSSLLELLETLTLESVQFETFNFSTANQEETGIQLRMNGHAVGFSAVALQADEIANSPYFKDPVFSNLSVLQTGEVEFSVTAIVDSNLLRYESRPVVAPTFPAEDPIVDDLEDDLDDLDEILEDLDGELDE